MKKLVSLLVALSLVMCCVFGAAAVVCGIIAKKKQESADTMAAVGIILGIIVAAVRSTYDMNGAAMKKKGGPAYIFLRIGNFICNLFLTVIRGTPVVVQLMIMYFIILINVTNGVLVAVIAFGINSGAYVAEIFRSGIMSIDEGQIGIHHLFIIMVAEEAPDAGLAEADGTKVQRAVSLTEAEVLVRAGVVTHFAGK